MRTAVMNRQESIADKQQLVGDWVWFNKMHYKRIGQEFDLRLVDSIYCALKLGQNVSLRQTAALNSIIWSRHIRDWQAEHYPAWKGKAPLPVTRPPETLDSFAFLPDDHE
jgi:hypothetical protein